LIPGQPNDHYWEKNGASKPKSEPASLIGCQIIHLPGVPFFLFCGNLDFVCCSSINKLNDLKYSTQ